MAIISANLQFNRGGHGLLDYSSLQKNYSTALVWAQDANSNAAVGQFIYLEEAETIEGVEYAKGPYVVDAIGEGAVLTPLSKSVAGNPDLASLVSNLQGEVGTLKTGLATTDSSVKTLETTVAAIPTTYATKAEVEEAIGDIDFSTLATKEEVSTSLAAKADASTVYTKEEVDAELTKKLEANDVSTFATKSEVEVKADASTVYTKDEADGKYVAKEGYVAYTQEEKDKLAGLANIKSVGDNLSVDENGKLEVSIPEVEVPFQSVAEGDKVLKLENGVLSSTLSYAREAVEGVDSLVLKGIDGNVIGSVPVADFVADGMLESVTPVEGTNKFLFTFKTGNGTTESFEVDFSKFVDVYKGDDATIELDSTTNTFSVKANVFDAYGSAAQALTDANDYSDQVLVDAKDYADGLAVNYDASGAAATAEQNAKDYADSLAVNYDASGAAASVEAKLDAYKESNDAALESGLAAKVDASVYNNKMTEIDGSISSIKTDLSNVYTKGEVDGLVSPLAVKADVSAALDLKANVADVNATVESLNSAIDSKVNKETYESKIGEIETTIGTLAVKADVSAALDLKANAADVYTKSDVDGLVSPLATSEELTNGLATKLDVSAKVNGVSFVEGEATIDAGDIALASAITRDNEGVTENVYEATTSIQSVLASLSQRIDVLDPNVSGELGITSIISGNGINASTSGGQATISVKASEVEGNMAEVKTDGVYVADMRSYWEAI